jgi:malonyl-CoA O-methyltransferase
MASHPDSSTTGTPDQTRWDGLRRTVRRARKKLHPLIRAWKIGAGIAEHAWEGKRRRREMVNVPECYRAAMRWVEHNTVPGQGIKISHSQPEPYPEVTGYYIPTLLNCGEVERAASYARWLLAIQNSDGSWSDPLGKAPYTFDSGQILKGLVAILPRMPEAEPAVRRGCDWMLEQIDGNGRVTTPDKGLWGLAGRRQISENIHLYALEPVRDAGRIFGEDRYQKGVARALDYYLRQPDLVAFNTLSHLHAYVLEALLDLGCKDEAARGMAAIERLQGADGSVPAFPDVRWVCSTGLAQYAVIWYKLGRIELAEKAFNCVCRLQNPSGGFFGSYPRHPDYFPDQEISWAVKYFLDAHWWHSRAAVGDQVTPTHSL